jgi:outer membrane protein assembly factor BamB
MRKKLVFIGLAVALALGGAAIAYALAVGNRPEGELITQVTDVSYVSVPSEPEPPPTTEALPPATTAEESAVTEEPPPITEEPPSEPVEGPCWSEFGGNPQRTLARTQLDLGRPKAKPVWVRGVGSYMEYPPSFCDGTVYVNTFGGRTAAYEAETGRLIWSWQSGTKASSPAVAGDYLVVSSHDGSITGLDRARGKVRWRIETHAKVESSPVAMDGIVYVGSTDGRLFALNAANGHVRWAYDTGGRINSSPSVWGNRVCITTYAGSIFCLRRDTGEKLWDTYVKRDAFRYESFYASPSTDGRRLFTVARSGKVVALNAQTGSIVWTASTGALTYSTPAVADGRIFVGGFDGALHAYDADSGRLLWESRVGGRILGPALVVGDLVFFSNLETNTFAARVSNGQIVWRISLGKYAPGIATDQHYYFSLNGLLMAFEGTGRP